MSGPQSAADEVLCRCSGLRREQLLRLAAEGVRELERLSRITGACSGCGGCEADVAQLLAEAVRAAQQ